MFQAAMLDYEMRWFEAQPPSFWAMQLVSTYGGPPSWSSTLTLYSSLDRLIKRSACPWGYRNLKFGRNCYFFLTAYCLAQPSSLSGRSPFNQLWGIWPHFQSCMRSNKHREKREEKTIGNDRKRTGGLTEKAQRSKEPKESADQVIRHAKNE